MSSECKASFALLRDYAWQRELIIRGNDHGLGLQQKGNHRKVSLTVGKYSQAQMAPEGVCRSWRTANIKYSVSASQGD